MGLGNKIIKLRNQKGMTQKDLSDLLFVTPQAISRWEKGQVEPNIDTIKKLCEIFDVSLDELLDVSSNKEEDTKVQNKENVKLPIGVCHKCDSHIFKGDKYHKDKYEDEKVLICDKCYIEENKKDHEDKLARNKKAFKLGIIFGSIGAAIGLIITIVCSIFLSQHIAIILPVGIVLSYGIFGFIYCLFAKNTFIEYFWFRIAEFGFVRFPGIIFTLNGDGIMFFIILKIIFGILSFVFIISAMVLATLICIVLSTVVFPFSIHRSIHKPEKYDE